MASASSRNFTATYSAFSKNCKARGTTIKAPASGSPSSRKSSNATKAVSGWIQRRAKAPFSISTWARKAHEALGIKSIQRHNGCFKNELQLNSREIAVLLGLYALYIQLSLNLTLVLCFGFALQV